jgi:hypothetical protein
MCLIAVLPVTSFVVCTAAATTAPAEPDAPDAAASDPASNATEDPASDAAASEEPDSADFDFPESWGPINMDDSWFPTAEPTSAGAADEGGQ